MDKAQFLTRFHHAKKINSEADFPLREPGKPAAVLLPILEYKNALTVLFTVRASHLKHHAGQVSFPGGKQEPTDHSLIETALRETHEEVGLPPEKVEIVGNLPLYRTVSRYEVRPYVGFIGAPTSLILDKNEVDRTFEVPLNFLMDKSNHLIHWVKRKDEQFPVYFIPWKQYNIWGATAAFVRNLSNHF
ncbi:CoA pyrophosphatase [uncultured Paraglaciecola sp.]|uniref:CoA pyrophosphatase n=1 Tax=uncultured Paraglaciecola sp. TaxID=1765024 RepID=UPI002608E1A7|nr:CoA pyrophosphatase [uncultured Paraglaciecola sp.]